MDDSASFDEHVTLLRSIFDRLRESGIQLKPLKYLFASNVANFQGYELSCDGIKPQNRLTEAIVNFDMPESLKELKRFLGIVGFYRCFIKNFADITEPLHQLTRDKVRFEWALQCDKAFNKLKEFLITKPILAYPQSGELFVLEVDGSDVAVGGVLSQHQDDGTLHPVAYSSNTLTEMVYIY